MKNVVVISAHPDDEILGVGGTLFRHKAEGDALYWVVVTNMDVRYGYPAEKVAKRQEEIATVAKMLGVKKVFKLDLEPMMLNSDSVVTMITEISKVFHEVKPEVIYTLNRSDAHSDHRYLSDAVMACTKSFRYPFIKEVLMYECLFETEFAPAFPEKVFIPNYFVDISAYMEDKLKAMEVYESELAPHPFPRSLENIKALATYRGAVAGVQYAEAFQLVKLIKK